MAHSSRRQNRVNGPSTLIERGESGEHPGGGAASRPEQSDNPQPGEGDQFRGGISMSNSLLGYQSRSPLFRTVSRSSSGYFSFESEPSSPLMTHNKSTQTPSPSSQVLTHAGQRISQDSGQNHEVWPAPPNPYRAHSPPAVGDMRPEVWVAQELRRIGDEFNNLYLQGALAGRNGQAAPAGLQQVHNEPGLLLWMGLLIGRLLQIILRRR